MSANKKTFICHSSKDLPLIIELIQQLESLGQTCWYAPRDIPPGQSYAAEIVKGVRECGVFLLFLTQNSIQSTHVIREVEQAIQNRDLLFLPIKLEACEISDELSYYIGPRQILTVDPRQVSQSLETLSQSLPGLLNALKAAPPLTVAATAPAAPSAPASGSLASLDSEFKAIHGVEVTRKHIEDAVAIDQIYYRSDMQGQVETCLEWQKQNPDIYTMLIDTKNDRLVGYINAMPIEKEYLDQIVGGHYIDAALPADAILPYDFPDLYCLYFSSIAVHPDYRGSRAVKRLYDAFLEKLLKLSEEEFFISDVYADAVSKEGVKLAEAFGMVKLNSTSHDSTIYHVAMMPPGFRATSKVAEKLKEAYLQSIHIKKTA